MDLDEVASTLTAKLRQRPEITRAPLTWQDASPFYDTPLEVRRAAVSQPASLGVRLYEDTTEGKLVFYSAGWADREFWDGRVANEYVSEGPGYDEGGLTLDEWAGVVGRLLSMFPGDLKHHG